MQARTPDYELSVKLKDSGEQARIGGAWKNEGGSITIKLNLCTVLAYNPNMLITLFPKDSRPAKKKQYQPNVETLSSGGSYQETPG